MLIDLVVVGSGVVYGCHLWSLGPTDRRLLVEVLDKGLRSRALDDTNTKYFYEGISIRYCSCSTFFLFWKF